MGKETERSYAKMEKSENKPWHALGRTPWRTNLFKDASKWSCQASEMNVFPFNKLLRSNGSFEDQRWSMPFPGMIIMVVVGFFFSHQCLFRGVSKQTTSLMCAPYRHQSRTKVSGSLASEGRWKNKNTFEEKKKCCLSDAHIPSIPHWLNNLV